MLWRLVKLDGYRFIRLEVLHANLLFLHDCLINADVLKYYRLSVYGCVMMRENSGIDWGISLMEGGWVDAGIEKDDILTHAHIYSLFSLVHLDWDIVLLKHTEIWYWFST